MVDNRPVKSHESLKLPIKDWCEEVYPEGSLFLLNILIDLKSEFLSSPVHVSENNMDKSQNTQVSVNA